MLVNFRGASGSGKSTAMRAVMLAIGPDWVEHFIPGRKQPLYYTKTLGDKRFAVMGHYNTVCGGCDTITKVDDTFNKIKELAIDHHVLFEGLLLIGEVRRTVELSHLHKLLVIAMDVPLDVCVRSINDRRYARNPDLSPIDPRGTISKLKNLKSATKRLVAANVSVEWLTREEVVGRTLEVLGVEA